MITNDVTQTYARALFELANAANAVDAVDESLRTIAATVAESVELREALSDSSITSDIKRSITSELFAGQAPEAVAVCALVLERQGADKLYPLQREFADIAEKERGIVAVEIVTASPINDELRTSLVDKLVASLGHPVSLRESVDESIIGGIRLSVGDRVLDGTVSSQLDAVKVALSNTSLGGEV